MGFKEAINEYGKQITASFVYNGVRYRDEQILSMNPHFEGSLLKTVMKCLDIELDRELLEDTCAIVGLAIAGKAVSGVSHVKDDNTIKSPMFGVKASSDTDYSYVKYGTYLIKESKQDEENKTISLECYDLMLQSMIPYDLVLDYKMGITVKDFLDAICDRLGWKKGYTTFYNCDVLVDEEKYNLSDTFRDALDDIAGVAGGMIGFVDDALTVIYPTNSGEVIDEDNLKTLTMGKKFGPINSVVLSRTPQEDNIYRQDAASIAANGMTEIRIENNQIIDSHREDFMDGVCNALFGLSFELYDLESFGIGYLSFGELFAIKTADGVEHKALWLCSDLKITQGVSETSKLEEPDVTATDYTAASETDKTLKKTILRVDKQNGEIVALATKTKTISDDVLGLGDKLINMSELTISPEEVDIKVSEALESVDEKIATLSITPEAVDIKISQALSGVDSIETSTGYTFDKDGLNIHKDGEEMHNTLDNKGMYVRRNNTNVLVADSEGVNAINLTARQYLIIGNNARFEDYTNGSDTRRTGCFYIGG